MHTAARTVRTAAASTARGRKLSLRPQGRQLTTSVFAFDLLKTLGLSGGDESKKEGKNDSILEWARKAKMGCELAPKTAPEGLELATFAGGCFWGLELQMQRVPGVVGTSVGYTQGSMANPTYEAVCSGTTGHTEAVQVTYNPSDTTFTKLLEAFADKTDLTTLNRQGSDRGTQYRSGVYFHSDAQKAETEAFFKRLNEEIAAGKRPWAGRAVVAEIAPAGDYYVAEEYHQQYLAKGGRFGRPQSAAKGCDDEIRCYG